MKVPQIEKDQINATFSENALKMMKKRYLMPFDDGGQEMPADMMERVANALALVEKKYKHDQKFVDQVARDFFSILSNKEYTPAGRTMTNVGTGTPLIANCIVLPIEDSMESIFQTLKEAALLQQAGSGLGFSLSSMRPADYETKKSRGRASGPVSFLRVYDTAFGTIKQQGRHGANMAMMNIHHPDILDFITCKKVEGDIRNFNISVTVSDEFMKQVVEAPDTQWYCDFKGQKVKPHRVLRYPNGATYGSEEVDITARELFNMIVEGAWKNGEPGIVYIDEVNRTNPLPGLGRIETSNPCGEQFLHPYDNCNLGSINLAKFVSDKQVNWDRLKFVTRTSVRMMDNVIDLFDFPVQQVTDLAKNNRRIGLGIMGFADMLFQLEIPYNTEKGRKMGEQVMSFINREAHQMSQELAVEKGEFPNTHLSIFAKKKIKMRNAALTTVAPTGSISMMLDCSSGLEPIFALYFVKQDKDGVKYNYMNEYLEKAIARLNLSETQKKEVMDALIAGGSIQSVSFLPKTIRDTFVTAMEISGEDHMKMQAAFQKHVDNSISKTINLPNSATHEDVYNGFISAWKLKCKSCTVYRDGSRMIQVLHVGKKDNILSTTSGFGASQSTEEKATAEDTSMRLDMDRVRLKPRVRPDVMTGKTYKLKTGYGTLYVTINDDETGVPFEVFASMGKTGGYFQEQSEALCRLISLSLRSGIKIEAIIDDLKGIRGPMPIFTNKGLILSLPDAIGQIMAEHVTGAREMEHVLAKPDGQEALPMMEETKVATIADTGFMPGCPDCGNTLTMAEGCISCKACGFSRCG
ncbi:MAG: adenosylcobalamin-dependent ribonucleoside-diphosphate reductase [Patescibacteria group bacterium]